MPRAASLASLTSAVRVVEPGSTNLGALVDDHAEELAPLLGVRAEWLRGRRGTPDDHLGPDLERLLRLRADGLREAARRAAEQRSYEAAARLAATARVAGGQVELDTVVLFGDLLSDPTVKHIALRRDDVFDVSLPRAKLVQIARAIKRTDLSAWVDARGLHLRWRAGRGGLDLYPRVVPRLERDRVLHVVFAAPLQPAVENAAVRERPAARHWFASVLSEWPALP